jgi:cytidyltransferase-like protein
MLKKFISTIACVLLLAACHNSSSETKKTKPVVVYVDMIADMFHPGHVSFLKKAKAQGDYLIVGIIGDEVATDYKRTPIMTLEERSEMVRSCRYVDEVIENSPICVPSEFLDEHKIDWVVHGDDYAEGVANYCFQAAIDRGIYKTVPYTPGISTSDIIKRILSRGESILTKKLESQHEPNSNIEKTPATSMDEETNSR